jgi:SAM-dependent methyltransferase
MRPYNEESVGRMLSQLVNEKFKSPMEKANAKFTDAFNYKGPSNRKHYACIHLPVIEFVNHYDTWREGGWYIGRDWMVKNPPKLKFLDVGCGVGQKVWMFSKLANDHWESHGLEYDSEMVSLASGLVGEKCSIFQGDGIKWDNYGDYDLIYFYCPLNEREGQMMLEERIMRKAKVGAVVWCVYHPAAFADPLKVKDLGWEQHHDHRWLFKKVKKSKP